MENSKKKRKINFFDIIIILLILAAGVVAYLLTHGEEATVETTTRSYMVELNNLDSTMADSIQVGDAVTDTIKNYAIGTVTEVKVVPYTLMVANEETGDTVSVEVPDKINLQVTIEAETIETDKSVQTASGYELRVGTSVSVNAGSLHAAGYILALDR